MERIDIDRLTIRYSGVEAHRVRESLSGLRGELLGRLSELARDRSGAEVGRPASDEGHSASRGRTVSALRARTADAIVARVRAAREGRR